MKKEDLKNKFNFRLTCNDNWTDVYSKDDDILCSIYEGAEGVFRTNYYGFKELKLEDKKELLKIITEYSLTPIEERERYFKYRLKWFSNECKFRYYLKYEDAFSLENADFSVFKEDDPRLDEVDLEMFEQIEVDKGGNEY